MLHKGNKKQQNEAVLSKMKSFPDRFKFGRIFPFPFKKIKSV